MSGFIKNFENNKKKMSFLTDVDVILKYNKIWGKKLLSVELDSQSVYDEKCIKTRIKIFEGNIITRFTDNKIQEENSHYSCIAAIYVDSVIKLEKENYP